MTSPAPMAEPRGRRVQPRTILALMLLLAVLAGGWVLIEQQRAGQRQQLDAIHLNTACLIANGHLVQRGGVTICVDAAGREIDLPAD